MIFNQEIRLSCSHCVKPRRLIGLFVIVLVNLRWHCCQGFHDVEKLVVPVPIDISILKAWGSQSPVQAMDGNEASSGDKSRRLALTKPLFMDVDLSILSSKEPTRLINNKHHQTNTETRRVHQRIQPPWDLQPHLEPNRQTSFNPRFDSRHSNQLDIIPFTHQSHSGHQQHGSPNYDKVPYFPSNQRTDDASRQKTSFPVVEDALVDYLRDMHYNEYGSDEERADYDPATEDEEYPEEPYWYNDDTGNDIIPAVNKKSEMILPFIKSKNRKPNFKAEYWRLAHKLRNDHGRRKFKRSTGSLTMAKYLTPTSSKNSHKTRYFSKY